MHYKALHYKAMNFKLQHVHPYKTNRLVACSTEISGDESAHACRWLQGVKPTLLAQSEGAPGHVHLQGVRHPLLLQPCLSPLPDIPTSPAFISDASDGLSSDSDLDITTSWRAMHTDSEYSEWMSGEEDRKVAEGSEGQSGEAGWPTALDLKVPEGARVVAVTGPNTGVLLLEFYCLQLSVCKGTSIHPNNEWKAHGSLFKLHTICHLLFTCNQCTAFMCRWEDSNAQDAGCQCADGPGRHVLACVYK